MTTDDLPNMTRIGTIYAGIGSDSRSVYLTLENDKEAYRFHEADFRQALTRYAAKGCHLKNLAGLVEK